MSYKRIGDFIELVDTRNKDLKVTKLLGLSIAKQFIPSVANTIGTNMRNYKIIRKNQFACSVMQVRRDKKMPVALLKEFDKAIISQAYPVFQVIDESELLPDYLMMWFTRSEFDRQATFHAVGGVRGSLEWDDFLDFKLPIPSIEKQQQIVDEYNTITNRIQLNEKINTNLEATAQALYKHWFVDFEFPNEDGKPYKSSGGKMMYNEELDKDIPVRWSVGNIGSLTKVETGFAFKSKFWCNEGLPVIKIGSINNSTIDFDALAFVPQDAITKNNLSLAKKGDIVIAMTGATIGKIGLIPDIQGDFLVNQRVGLFKTSKVGIAYLYINLKSKEIINQINNVGGDSAQANISNTQIEAFTILIPNDEVMQKFNLLQVASFDRIINHFSQKRTLEQLQNLLLAKMTQVALKPQIV